MWSDRCTEELVVAHEMLIPLEVPFSGELVCNTNGVMSELPSSSDRCGPQVLDIRVCTSLGDHSSACHTQYTIY